MMKLTEAQENKLKNQHWRLNHLYFIRNEAGEKVRFKFNPIQEILYRSTWYLNIVLKSRQIGSTTFWCLLFLDTCLFNRNKSAAIIAHTKEAAEDIFTNKIKFAFENLPLEIKEALKGDEDTKGSYAFSNGSRIIVATSTRSGTHQLLLVSEFGPMCFKYPEKAQEVITGSLNTVHAGQFVVIESTAKGRQGRFYELCQRAYDKKLSGDKLSQMDYKFHFFPWWQDARYKLTGNYIIPSELQDYFRDLAGKEGINLTQEQKNWYVKKKETQEEDIYSEFPSTAMEAFKANVEGAYYLRQLNWLYENKRIGNVPHDPLLPVDTWWDLGIGDDTAIIFTQFYGHEIRIIDYYENNGEGLEHYARVLRERGYNYRSHNAPHDIAVKELGTGKSRLELARAMGINFRVIENIGIEDGIEATRVILKKCWIDEGKAGRVVDILANYRKEWDDKHGVFKSYPLHDEFSHGADALRSLGVGYRTHTAVIPDTYADKYRDDLGGVTTEEADTDTFFPQL